MTKKKQGFTFTAWLSIMVLSVIIPAIGAVFVISDPALLSALASILSTDEGTGAPVVGSRAIYISFLVGCALWVIQLLICATVLALPSRDLWFHRDASLGDGRRADKK